MIHLETKTHKPTQTNSQLNYGKKTTHTVPTKTCKPPQRFVYRSEQQQTEEHFFHIFSTKTNYRRSSVYGVLDLRHFGLNVTASKADVRNNIDRHPRLRYSAESRPRPIWTRNKRRDENGTKWQKHGQMTKTWQKITQNDK